MQRVITNPTDPEDLANLRDALQALMPPKSDYFRPAGDYPTKDSLATLSKNLAKEREYGVDTGHAVAFFQRQEGIPISRDADVGDRNGVVGQFTAARLNLYLSDLGAFDPPGFRRVQGLVSSAAAGTPLPNMSVALFDQSASPIVLLASTQTNAIGRYTMDFTFSRGQRCWVGVQVSDRTFDPNRELAEGDTRIITADLTVSIPTTDTDFTVKGTVRRPPDGTSLGLPVPDIVVAVYVASEGDRRLAVSDPTDADGQYRIAATAIATAALVVGIEANGVLVARSSSWGNRTGVTVRDLEVPVRVSQSTYVVHGQVTGLLPAGGVAVRAYDKDIRSEQFLGESRPGSDGRYLIGYERVNFERVERPGSGAELRMRVYGPGGEELPVTPTRIPDRPYNAPLIAEIDLEVGPVDADGLSEFERHIAGIEPVRDEIPIAEFTAADVEFVAGETDIDADHVAWLQIAHAFAAASSSAAAIPAAAFYAWFRNRQPTQMSKLVQVPAPALEDSLRWAIRGNIVPASLEASIDAILIALGNAPRAALAQVLTPLDLPDSAQAALGRGAGMVGEISNGLVAKLVDNGALTQNAALDVGLAVSLHELLGGQTAAAEAIRVMAFPRLNDERLGTSRDLARLNASDWSTALQASGATPPEGTDVATYAIQLARTVAKAFPTDYLLHRVTDTAPLRAAWNDLQPLRRDNPDLLTREFSRLDQRSIAAVSRSPQWVEQHAAMRRFLNLHPGLKLAELLHDTPDAQQGLAAVDERLGWVAEVQRLNQGTVGQAGGVDLLAVDYLPASANFAQVRFGALTGDQQAQVVTSLKAYQRVQLVTADSHASEALLGAGLHSAGAIAKLPTQEIVSQTGLAFDEALAYRVDATRQAERAALTWFALHDAERDSRLLPASLTARLPEEYLQQLPGYAQLFGSVDSCDCDPCDSMLSPAAYFVDLMFYVERFILQRPYTLVDDGHELPRGLGEDQPLHLKSRRPDLWQLPLTCGNTKEFLPTLQVALEALEAYIAKVKGVSGEDRNRLYAVLAGMDRSPAQPFCLPLTRLGLLLGHFASDRYQIASRLALPDTMRSGTTPARTTRARARLRLPFAVAQRVLGSRLGDLGAAAALYTVWTGSAPTLQPQADLEIAALPVRPLMQATGLDRDTLIGLIASDFVSADGSTLAPVTTRSVIATPGGVQNDTELIEHLSLRRLDRFEVFLRVWKTLPWTIAELAYVLRVLRDEPRPAGAEAPLHEGNLIALVELLDIQDRWKLPVDELCALCGPLPAIALQDPRSLWDRRFNLRPFADTDGLLPTSDETDRTRFFRPAALAPDGKASPSDRTQQRLAAALQLPDAELVTLFLGLEACFVGAASNENPVPAHLPIPMSRTNLALLYRHARLARLLGIKVADLLTLMALTPAIGQRADVAARCVASRADVTALLAMNDWVATSGFTLERIRDLCRADGQAAEAARLAASIVDEVRVESALCFADTVFTLIGLNDADSRAVVLANAGPPSAPIEVVAASGGSLYRLRSDTAWDDATAPLLTLGGIARERIEAWLAQAVLVIAARGDFDGGSFAELGLDSATWTSLLIQPNTGDGKAFEATGAADTRWRLRVGSAAALLLAALSRAQLDGVLNLQCRRLLARYDAITVLTIKLARALQRTPDSTAWLLRLVNGATRPSASAQALQGGDSKPLVAYLGEILRRADLLVDAAIDTPTLALLATNPDLMSISRQGPIEVEAVRLVALYMKLATPPDAAYASGAVMPVGPDSATLLERASRSSLIHVARNGSDMVDIDAASVLVARALGLDLAIVRPLLYQLTETLGRTLSGLDGLQAVVAAVAQTQLLGISPEVLAMSVTDCADAATEFEDLSRAAEGVYGAFRAKHPDQAESDRQLEPFEDQLRSLTRDALVDCLLHDDSVADWQRRFRSANDLFDHFLMDVLVEGCARTSRLVAAISSVQLYVQRVLMHLEQFMLGDDPRPLVMGFAHDASGEGQRRAAEWAWRQHYRVWEANRKVFLYPENYVEPGLRDDKTPLFKALEDTLLQQEIGPQTALDAYAGYLAGLDEIAALNIAGAFHDQANGADVLHLFGATSTEPPAYYYRTIRQLKKPENTQYSAWEPINVQIPARAVSPVVVQGRLIVLWLETTTRQLSDIKDGSSKFSGYRHTVRTKFTQLRLDGRWSPPQTLQVSDSSGAATGALLVADPLVTVTVPTPASRARSTTLTRDPTRLATELPALRLYDPTGERYDQTGDTDTGIEIGDFPDPPPASGVPNMPPPPANTTSVLSARWDERFRSHEQPLEDYTPGGWKWDRLYPSVWSGIGTWFPAVFVPTAGEPQLKNPPRASSVDLRARTLYLPSGAPPPISALSIELLNYQKAQGDLILHRRNYQSSGTAFADATFFLYGAIGTAEKGDISLLRINASAAIQIVNGNEGGAVIQVSGQSFLLIPPSVAAPRYQLRQLGTTLLPQMGMNLAAPDGVARLLDTASQKQLIESEPPIAVIDGGNVAASDGRSPFDKNAGLAAYFREIHFHIPFLVADHLNSRQKFSDARYWYDFVFNPTANNEAGDPEATRPWRYLEFRSAQTDDFHKNLTDPAALLAYQEDPFNPHAIARLRPSAYKKAVVMKYIDNLLDWGDDLFSQFTTESVNESMMLYVMASEILGPRPITVGPCKDGPTGTDAPPPRTYAGLKPFLSDTSDLLIECESIQLKLPFARTTVQSASPFVARWEGQRPDFIVAPQGIAQPLGRDVAANDSVAPAPVASQVSGWNRAAAISWTATSGTPLSTAYLGAGAAVGVTMSRLGSDTDGRPAPSAGGARTLSSAGGGTNVPIGKTGDIRPFGALPPRLGAGPASVAGDGVPAQLNLSELVSAKTVFCLPGNKDLLGYWDRVEDRLYKIRNCMDIAGVRRNLELFAPEIDPKFLVRMRAAGLSLDDVMNSTSGHLPPYRFLFLIDKAKQHASLVQSFGGQLLNALEKKDAEELSMLRTVHEQNLLKLRSSMTEWEVTAALDTLASLEKQKEVTTYRRDYYQKLADDGLNPWERTHQVLMHGSNALTLASSLLAGTGGILSLIPNLGAPTSLNYGGRELGSAAKSWADVLRDTSGVMQLGASSASLEGSNLRRDQEWRNQAEVASRELLQIDKQIAAAEIRRDIATQTLAVHQRTVDQSQEVYDFLRERFSNFGRYTWLASQLQKLNRGAFNAALSMATLAEQAYRYERPDDVNLLSGDYWSADNAGLLAGERLQVDLQQLEQRFIETNYRTLEVEQSFSLALFNPSALLALRLNGNCSFSVPEVFFDLAYPGQYRRRIKAVRLTLPCVIGPYSSVGATLTMTASRIRNTPDLSETALVSVPLRHMTTIAASTAQNDSGVFEFSFRDERYMPYEGAGAISDWNLTLPKRVRPFDYGSISDVIVRIAYSSVEDSALRARVDDANGAIVDELKRAGISRIFSVRDEFPSAWSTLLRGTVGTNAGVSITPMHLPFFLQDGSLATAEMELLLGIGNLGAVQASGFAMPVFSFDAARIDSFVPDGAMTAQAIFKASVGPIQVVKAHTLILVDAGDMSTSSRNSTTSFDDTLLADILIRVTWRST